MTKCYRCGGESRRPAGEPCRFRDGVGHPCGGRLVEPETMTCTRCGADVEVTTNTEAVLPWVEILHTSCGGRLATKVAP
jgi:hypothetical protein